MPILSWLHASLFAETDPREEASCCRSLAPHLMSWTRHLSVCLPASDLSLLPQPSNLSLSLFLSSRLLIRFAGCLLPCCVGDACLLASTHGDLFATRMYPSCVNVMQGRQALIVRERKDFACLVCSDTVRTTDRERERDLPLPLYPASSSRLSLVSLSLSVCQ